MLKNGKGFSVAVLLILCKKTGRGFGLKMSLKSLLEILYAYVLGYALS